MEFLPQNVKIPRVLFDHAGTLASKDLVEALQNPTPDTPFATINETNYATLRIIAELFNIIPKAAEQQSTNRHNRRHRERQDVASKSDQVSAPVTHQ